jgi:hypothetical protein
MNQYPFNLPTPLPTVVVKTRDEKERDFLLSETVFHKGYYDKVIYNLGDPLRESPDDVVSIEIYYPKKNG